MKKLRVILFWGLGLGLVWLGSLGYAGPVWGFHITRPGLFLIAFVILAVSDRLLTYYSEKRVEARARQFKIISSKTIAKSAQLNGLAWDGSRFWLTGKINDTQGVFKLNEDLTIGDSIAISDSFPYAIVARENLIVLTSTRGGCEAREYTTSGVFKKSTPLAVECHDGSAYFASDGSQFWVAVDYTNAIYTLSLNYTVLREQPLPHRVMGATYARNRLWITDAYKIYEYDRDLNLLDTYPYTGTTCRGIAFDKTNLWSLDDGPKRIHKHYVV